MKFIKLYHQFENQQFFNPDKDTIERLEKWINQKLTTNPDFKLSSWIYQNIIRKSGSQSTPELKQWIKEKDPDFKKLLDGWLQTWGTKYELIRVSQDPQGEWLGVNFNENKKQKQVVNGKELTYNYYITFERTTHNFKQMINSLSDLISRFYKACQSGELAESAVSLKFGYHLVHFIEDNDHLKFYWYNKEDEPKVEKIVNDWLQVNKISTVQRPYNKGVDTGQKSSWGTLVSDKVEEEFSKLVKTHGTKYTPQQYAKWIINMLNTTKFNF